MSQIFDFSAFLEQQIIIYHLFLYQNYFMNFSFVEAERRPNTTSFTTRVHRKRLSYAKQNIPVQAERPNTTSFGRTQNHNKYHNVQEAENFLSLTFREQMNGYIKKKIRNLTIKNNEAVVLHNESPEKTLRNPEETLKFDHKPKYIRQMNFCNMSFSVPKRREKVIGQPYLKNVKERLTRLISLKKDQDKQFQKFEEEVKKKSIKKQNIRKTEEIEFKNPVHMQTLQWDKQWNKDVAKERNRYRTRLAKKHRRNMTSATISW